MNYGVSVFFFNDTATTEIYTLSLHDALPIYRGDLFAVAVEAAEASDVFARAVGPNGDRLQVHGFAGPAEDDFSGRQDRKSTRLNSSHANISYAVFCLKKKYNNYHLYSSSY